jgi:uncharacterized protein (TIGR03435 family)
MARPYLTIVIAALSARAFAQTPDTAAFEVASIRPSPPIEQNARVFLGPPRGGPGTSDPGQITWKYAALRNILTTAFDVQTFQLTAPDWLQNERFDIVAKVPPGATKAQVLLMWQSLLKERFGLVVHHESKEFKVENLTVAKGGSKLKETELPPDADTFDPTGAPMKMDSKGFPELGGKGLILMIRVEGRGAAADARMVAKAMTLAELASRLGQQLRQPVLDQTNLTGRYDFTLEYTPDMSGVPPPPIPGGSDGAASSNAAPLDSATTPGSTLKSALEKQLGLKLVDAKANLDVIVVDHVEKVPTEN